MLLNGSSGRMGRRIDTVVSEAINGVTIVARRDRGDAPSDVAHVDVIVDFSSDEGAREAASMAQKLNCALLVGTTGLTEATIERLREAARVIPVMAAPNTSVGIAVTRALVRSAAQLLGEEFTASISETHHTKKLDAPSGTALHLANALELGGKTIDRNSIEARREGDVIGDHTVTFRSRCEVLSITHHARDRELFARGAVALAKWISAQKPGFYAVDDWFQTLSTGAR